ncbi:hypothetical protein QOT17_020785 [Balamuthia mandrillaris]
MTKHWSTPANATMTTTTGPHPFHHHQDILRPPTNVTVSPTGFGTIATFITISFTSFASLWHQLAVYTLDTTTKQEFIEVARHSWEIQGSVELAAIDLHCLLHPGNASDFAMDTPSHVATPEAIDVKGINIDDDDNIEDDCEDKVEPLITAPILLNHQHTTAFIDSGASHFFISPAAAEKYLHSASCECHHTIIFHIDNMEITLDDRSTTCVTCCAAHVHINCGSYKLHYHFFIMLLQGEHEILFRKDIIQHISIGLFGLLVHYPLPSEFKEDSNISNKIAEGIHDTLQHNQQAPHGPSSSLRESIIYLGLTEICEESLQKKKEREEKKAEEKRLHKMKEI